MLGFARHTPKTKNSYRPTFDERKATHLAAYLLQKKDDKTLYILKLMKLMYIVDRNALMQLGHPVTFDNYVSMPHGPVLSCTYSLMGGMVPDNAGIWNAMISDKDDHKVSAIDCETSCDSLSEAEMEIADQVFDEYGNVPRFELVNITHRFPEWKDPEGSSLPLSYTDILQGANFEADEITSILDELEAQDKANKILLSVV